MLWRAPCVTGPSGRCTPADPNSQSPENENGSLRFAQSASGSLSACQSRIDDTAQISREEAVQLVTEGAKREFFGFTSKGRNSTTVLPKEVRKDERKMFHSCLIPKYSQFKSAKMGKMGIFCFTSKRRKSTTQCCQNIVGRMGERDMFGCGWAEPNGENVKDLLL